MEAGVEAGAQPTRHEISFPSNLNVIKTDRDERLDIQIIAFKSH